MPADTGKEIAGRLEESMLLQESILYCAALFAEQIVKSSIPPLAVESVSWLSPVLFRAYLQNEQYWSIQKRLERSRFRQKSQIHLQIIEIVSRNL